MAGRHDKPRAVTFSNDTMKKKRIELSDITDGEKQLIREMWIVIDHTYYEISIDIYTELFDRYPHFKNYFSKSFVDSDFKNPQVREHMMGLLPIAFRKLITVLDNVDEARGYMESLGKWHKNLNKGIKPGDVDLMIKVILDVLEEHLGPKTTPTHMAALKKLLQAAFIIFRDQLRREYLS